MNLSQQLAVLRSSARWILLGGVLAGLAAFALSQVATKTFEADTRILVGQALQSSNPDIDEFQSAINLAQTYGEIARSRTLLEEVMTEVGITEPIGEFEKRITVATSDQQPFIDIVAQGSSEVEVVAIANAVAAKLVERAATVGKQQDAVLRFADEDLAAMRPEIQALRVEIAALRSKSKLTASQELNLQTLESRLASARATYASLLQLSSPSQANRLTIIDPAVPPIEAASPRPLQNAVIAAILGLLVVVAVAFMLETLDDRIESAEEVEQVTGLTTLGTIARMPGNRRLEPFYRLASILYPRSPAAESFRILRTNLDFASLDHRLHTILITSSTAEEGKTVVASNLAAAYAQSGRRVILVDADLRRPSLPAMFNIQDDLGLTDLARTETLALADVIRSTELPNLGVVTSGILPANPAELLASRRIVETLARIREATDVVIIDCAPVGIVTDAAVLSPVADATVLVIRSRSTSKREVSRARQALAKVGANVVGVVLNDVRSSSREGHSYYGQTGAQPTVPITPSSEVAARVSTGAQAFESEPSARAEPAPWGK